MIDPVFNPFGLNVIRLNLKADYCFLDLGDALMDKGNCRWQQCPGWAVTVPMVQQSLLLRGESPAESPDHSLKTSPLRGLNVL